MIGDGVQDGCPAKRITSRSTNSNSGSKVVLEVLGTRSSSTMKVVEIFEIVITVLVVEVINSSNVVVLVMVMIVKET